MSNVLSEKRRARLERLLNRTNPPERYLSRAESRQVLRAAKKKGRK